ncbi:MAG: DUF4199 domain-containing protein [Bacteroidia bacterium]|nr:DUF4199 domain-containing protein [Bacteroidia bacterium]
MERSITKKDIWDSAAKSGLALGAVSIAYLAISQFMASMNSSTGIAVVMSLLSILLWAVKFAGCIFLMKLFMLKFAASHEGVTNADTFKFGMATAFLSALLYSGFYLAYVTLIAPDTFTDALAAVSDSYGSMMGSDALETLENMNLGNISFFYNLIYCFLFGTVLSAILSKNIPSRNPFNDNTI